MRPVTTSCARTHLLQLGQVVATQFAAQVFLVCGVHHIATARGFAEYAALVDGPLLSLKRAARRSLVPWTTTRVLVATSIPVNLVVVVPLPA
eukprot:COSAG06_NODE_42083_length_385_cov_0.541958_1_plen_91_part_10